MFQVYNIVMWLFFFFFLIISHYSIAQQFKNSPCNVGNTGNVGLILGSRRSSEEEVATHASILLRESMDSGALWAMIRGVEGHD